ncbi:hypothetical protein C8R46DRAFT_1062646 [Mycena filopes]|nr:hypothetical protein C8R46DRAFT_1062646 [Mycena filopes]
MFLVLVPHSLTTLAWCLPSSTSSPSLLSLVPAPALALAPALPNDDSWKRPRADIGSRCRGYPAGGDYRRWDRAADVGLFLALLPATIRHESGASIRDDEPPHVGPSRRWASGSVSMWIMCRLSGVRQGARGDFESFEMFLCQRRERVPTFACGWGRWCVVPQRSSCLLGADGQEVVRCMSRTLYLSVSAFRLAIPVDFSIFLVKS